MKNFLTAFLIFLVWPFFGLWLYSWLDTTYKTENLAVDTLSGSLEEQKQDIDNEKIDYDTSSQESINAIDTLNLEENTSFIKDTLDLNSGLQAKNKQGDIIFLFTKGISITKNSAEISVPKESSNFKYKVNTYLIENPDSQVEILALYDASENIESPNLGIQRGLEVKKLLVQTGIPSEKIVVKSVIQSVEFNIDNQFENGINIQFTPIDKERIELLKKSLPEPKTFYPKLVNNDIFVNEDLQVLLGEVKNVLAKDPNAFVELIGHTDNIGNANDNYLLALNYARQVRWFLINKGNLNPKRVVALSAGESKSIATNATERGRLLNRRIEVVYKTGL